MEKAIYNEFMDFVIVKKKILYIPGILKLLH
jgi:hypothetical protein